MTGGSLGPQLVDRIGFAERWLDRAKRQCRDGDVPRGLLTLFLANAEMTHTLRTAKPVFAQRRQDFAVSAFAIAAAMALAWVVLASSAGAPGKFTAEGPTIVTLGGRVGSLLEFVEAAPQHSIAPVVVSAPGKTHLKSVRRQRSLPRARLAPGTSVITVPKSAIAVRPAAPHPPTPLATSSSPAEAAVETGPDVELISLVLTAERTLRTQARP